MLYIGIPLRGAPHGEISPRREHHSHRWLRQGSGLSPVSCSYGRELGESRVNPQHPCHGSLTEHYVLSGTFGYLPTSLFPFSPTAWPWSLRTVGKQGIVPFHCPGASNTKSKTQKRCGTFTWRFQPAVSRAHRGIMSTLPSLECQTLSHHVPAQAGGGQLGVTPSQQEGRHWGCCPQEHCDPSQCLSACLPAGIHRGWSHSFRTGTDMLLLSCTILKAQSVAPKMDLTVVY